MMSNGKNTKVGIFLPTKFEWVIENNKQANVYVIADCPSGKSDKLSVCPIVNTLHISGTSSGRRKSFMNGNDFPTTIVINELKSSPTKYINPLKS